MDFRIKDETQKSKTKNQRRNQRRVFDDIKRSGSWNPYWVWGEIYLHDASRIISQIMPEALNGLKLTIVF